MPLKIAITGPEATGKSLLSNYLAKWFNGIWVEEYAREYLKNLNNEYAYADVEKMMVQQFRNEKNAEAESLKSLCPVFCDTDDINFLIWFQARFNNIPGNLKNRLNENKYDYTLLLYPDIAWESDDLRENPERGLYFFQRFKKELENRGRGFIVIKGEGDNRFNQAKEAIRKIKGQN